MDAHLDPTPDGPQRASDDLPRTLADALCSLPRPDASTRAGLASFAVARRAAEAREMARLQAEEAAWRPRLRSLADPVGSPPAWLAVARAAGLLSRRRWTRWQTGGAALAAAGLVAAVLLGRPPTPSAWQEFQATARPVPVTLREDLPGAGAADGPAPSPWSLPGGAP